MKQNFFAADLGATGDRTILGAFIEDGLNLEEINRFPNHLIEVGGHFYWDIYALYRYIIDGLKPVTHHGEFIASVSINTWGVDFVCVGRDGNLLRQLYTYRGSHIVGVSETPFSRISCSRVYDKTGIQIMNFNLFLRSDTLRHNHDSALETADRILLMPDALSYMPIGEMVTEYTIASTAQLVNTQTRHLEPELLEAVGLSEKNSGRFVFPGKKVGVLTEEMQEITGLGAIPVITIAGHDTGPAVVAVPTLDRNFAYLSGRTWSLMGAETDTPVVNAETEALSFTNESGVEGTVRLLKSICGMWLLERCRLGWEDTSYPELIGEADACKPFHSLINPDDDCFANPVDMEKAIAEYCRATGQAVPEKRGQVMCCIFESLALHYRQVLKNLRSLSPRPIDTLHVVDDGNRDDLLNQFTANAIGIPVVAGPSEAAAIGNVMIQAMTAGEATGVTGMRQLTDRSIPLKTHRPRDAEAWDTAYIHPKNYVR